MRIMVHSTAHLTDLSTCFCTVIRPGHAYYVCPVWHSRMTVAQSKALEFLWKRALKTVLHVGEYATNLIIADIETLSHDDRL